jgi:hypothetical protein
MSARDALGIAKQSALGTSTTTMEQWPPVEKVAIKDDSDKVTADETTGSRAPAVAERGVKAYTLQASGNARPQSLPKLLSAFFGIPVKTNPYLSQATAYSYLFDPIANDPAGLYFSLIAALKDPKPNPIYMLYSDVAGASVKLSAQPNGYLAYDAEFFALDGGSTSAPSPTLDATKRFTFDQIKCFLTVNGGAETEVKVSSWELAYDVGMDKDGGILGTRKRLYAEAGDLAATVSFTAKDNLDQHFLRAIMDDPDSVKVRLTATGATIAGSAAFLVEVIAYLVNYDEAPAGIDAKSRLNAVPVKGTCYLDPSTGKFVTVQVVNMTNNAA